MPGTSLTHATGRGVVGALLMRQCSQRGFLRTASRSYRSGCGAAGHRAFAGGSHQLLLQRTSRGGAPGPAVFASTVLPSVGPFATVRGKWSAASRGYDSSKADPRKLNRFPRAEMTTQQVEGLFFQVCSQLCVPRKCEAWCDGMHNFV
jgi:hypothetical protein